MDTHIAILTEKLEGLNAFPINLDMYLQMNTQLIGLEKQ